MVAIVVSNPDFCFAHVLNHIIITIPLPSASPATPVKAKAAEAAAAAAGASDCVNHTLVLTTLSHLPQTRTEDDALDWLAEQLLLTPEQHQQRVHFCLDLQVS